MTYRPGGLDENVTQSSPTVTLFLTEYISEIKKDKQMSKKLFKQAKILTFFYLPEFYVPYISKTNKFRCMKHAPKVVNIFLDEKMMKLAYSTG